MAGRRWKWGEFIFGPILATVVILPILLMLFFISAISGPPDVTASDSLIRLAFWLGCFIGMVAIISLWLVVLMGPVRIIRRPFLRWYVITTGILGLLAAVWIVGFYTVQFVLHRAEPKSNFLWVFVPMLFLAGPVAVGLRYLPRLLKGQKRVEEIASSLRSSQ